MSGMTPQQAIDVFRASRQKKRKEARDYRRTEARKAIERLKCEYKNFPARMYNENRYFEEPIFWLRKSERNALIRECSECGWLLSFDKTCFGGDYVEIKPTPSDITFSTFRFGTYIIIGDK